MNWLDALALGQKVWGIYEKWRHLDPGQTGPFLLRTKIKGKMWRFTGQAGPEA